LIRYGRIENFPPHILGRPRKLALLFKRLATLRWHGPTPAFAKWAKRMKAPRLVERCEKAAGR
jgi:hypothetical protein